MTRDRKNRAENPEMYIRSRNRKTDDSFSDS